MAHVVKRSDNSIPYTTTRMKKTRQRLKSLIQPSEIWGRLSPELQRQISDELSTILQEVLYEQIPAW